jgi:hypothetical protein
MLREEIDPVAICVLGLEGYRPLAHRRLSPRISVNTDPHVLTRPHGGIILSVC